MVKFAGAQIVCATALFCLSLQAKDLPAHQASVAGDTDMSMPVTLEVIHPQATAALNSSEALKTPAIFESYPNVTNEVARQFLDVFANTRADFTDGLLDTFHQATLANATIASPNFGYFVTAFDAKNKKLPVTSLLAATWAQGRGGAAEEGWFLKLLLHTMDQPIRPDGQLAFATGDAVQLVPVNAPDKKPSPDDASRAEIITSASITTLSQARAELRTEFSQDDQLFARALSDMLKPNCAPDTHLTQLARNRAIAGLAGQATETIDSRTRAVLDELSARLLPGSVSQQITAERAQAQREKDQAELALQQQQEAQQERDQAQANDRRERAQAAAMQEQVILAQGQERAIHIRNERLAMAGAVISAFVLLITWRALRRRRTVASPIPVPIIVSNAKKDQPANQSVVPPEFAPLLAQAVKEALVQELAAQRRDMLSVQQAASSEIAELVRRLDQLQIPLQERQRTYEMQIQQLEKELAARTEENRELLKMKISMMRQQLETERKRLDFN